MLALPLLLALAVTAEATPPDPAGDPAAPIAEDEGPGFQVAPPDAPGLEAVAPAAPFQLGGFQPVERFVVGAAGRLGGSRRGFDGAFDATARWRGAVVGVTVGGAQDVFDHLSALGLLAGYGWAHGRYRGEALLGWGLVSDEVMTGLREVHRAGHFRSLQLGLDRACWGGEAWRASLGVGVWWRESFGLAATPSSHRELAAGLRLGVEAGWLP